MINAVINKDASKGTVKRLRNEGKIPGNMYGVGIPSTKIVFEGSEIRYLISHGGMHQTVELNVEGVKYNAIIKEVQKCHTTNKIIHIDLECFTGDKVINAEIPVNYINESIIFRNGAVIQKEKSSIKVRCKASQMPDHIDLVIKEKMLGHAIRISDIEIGEELTILDSLESVVASINFAKSSTVEENEEEVESPEIT